MTSLSSSNSYGKTVRRFGISSESLPRSWAEKSNPASAGPNPLVFASWLLPHVVIRAVNPESLAAHARQRGRIDLTLHASYLDKRKYIVLASVPACIIQGVAQSVSRRYSLSVCDSCRKSALPFPQA